MTRPSKRQRTICYPAGQPPPALKTAPAFRRRVHQIFLTNDYDLVPMTAWCQRVCRFPFGFYVKARVVFYASGTAVIQEEHLYAEFSERSEATAFRLRWA